MTSPRRLTSVDAQFLAIEDGRTHGHVCSLAIYDPSLCPTGTLTAEDVRTVVRQRLHRMDPLRWQLAEVPLQIGHPYWVLVEPDLELHITDIAVPLPGTDEQLANLVGLLHSTPLERGRPLWEMVVIHGLSGGRVGVLTKVHHAAVDGMSGGELLGILHDSEPCCSDRTDATTIEKQALVPSSTRLLISSLSDLPQRPIALVRSGWRALPHLDQVSTLHQLPGVKLLARSARRVQGRPEPSAMPTAPRTPFNERISSSRMFAFGVLPLVEVEHVRLVHGGTVNDLLVGLCAGALRTVLTDLGCLPEEPLTSLVPVSVRSSDESGTYGNRVSGVVVSLPTDEADRAARLARVRREMSAARQRSRDLPPSLLQDANDLVPAALLGPLARAVGLLSTGRVTAPPVNVAISTVRGSRDRLFLAGAELTGLFPASLIVDGVGLNMTVLGHAESLNLGVVVDRSLGVDPWHVVDAILAELAAVLAEFPAV